MSNFRIMLLSTAAIGFAGALATPASAGEVEKTASFSGHVNRAVGVVDNGDSTDFMSVDSSSSMSRIRFVGEAKSESLTTKAYFEFRARGGQSTNGTTVNSDGGGGGGTLGMRHSYLSLTNSMGSLVLGQTDPAGDKNNWFTGDKSGANWWANKGVAQNNIFSGKFLVKGVGTSTGPEETTFAGGVSPNTTVSAGRGGVIRYDTPDFNGFNASIGFKGGAQQSEEASASIGYSADFDGTAVAIGYGYTNKAGSSTTVKALHSVGGGFELANGINAYAAYFTAPGKAATDIDKKNWTIQVGYDMSVVDAGQTSVGLTYYNGDETVIKNDDFKSYGLNVNQSLADYGTDIYGSISRSEYSSTAANYEDITAGWVGVRVKF